MNQQNQNTTTALVLEGGGMRAIFTAGVIDGLLDMGFSPDVCYAVSAGAGHACSFFSGQRGRAARVVLNHMDDTRYLGLYSLLTTGDLFGADFIYNEISFHLDPIDCAAFNAHKGSFFAVLTNCLTGEAEYREVSRMPDDIAPVRASSSLPMVSRMVEIDGIPYLDGGIVDSIPIERALSSHPGTKALIVLTQHAGYRKEASSSVKLMRLIYRKYPALVEAMECRHIRYNNQLDAAEKAAAEGRALILRPAEPLGIGRTERSREKLERGYEIGLQTAKENAGRIAAFFAE